jgi:hypothetical protein
MTLHFLVSPVLRLLKSAGLAALTPILEKNAVKVLAHESAVVVSMSRSIVLGFAVVFLRDAWNTGIDGWPDASLGIATVLALPLMNSLERIKPDQLFEVACMVVSKSSSRAVRAIGEEYDNLPSKFDDHRKD